MKKYILGVDIGGTKIRVGLVTKNNQVIGSQKFLLERRNKSAALRGIVSAIASIFTNKVSAIGVGITGLVDPKKGIVFQSPNLPKSWRNVPLKKILQKKFKVPVAVDNDAHCFALGAATVGPGKKYPVVLAVTLGTGIGAGLVVNKKMLRNAINVSELGHTQIAEKSPPCSCGQIGHFEALASGRAMSNLYRQLTGRKLDPHEVEAEARTGDKKARSVIKTMSYWLAVGLANAIHAYNPEVIILGGGLSKVKMLVQPAIRLTPKLLIYPQLKKTKIIATKNLAKANVLGAAVLARQYIK